MSETKTKNHGFPTAKPRASNRPAIPRVLANAAKAGAIRVGPPSDELCRIYGKWKMKCIRACGLGYGVYAQPGDEFEIDGANALMLCGGGQAVFLDNGRMAEERRVLAEVEKLGLDKPIQVKHLPEFQAPAPESESTWR